MPSPSTSAISPAPWLSYHLFAPRNQNDILAEVLTPMLQDPKVGGMIRRWFFIRYSEGGHHLRLRFLPARSVDPSRLSHAIERYVELAMASLVSSVELAPDEWDLRRATYDREEHYFGANVQSVYAELLNEQTSVLALRLLRQEPTDAQSRALWLVAFLHTILVRTSASFGIGPQLDASIRFSRNASQGILGINPEIEPGQLESWQRALQPRLEMADRALSADPTTESITSLLRRLYRAENGAYIATHSLHLLCNKLGYSLPQEVLFFEALAHVAMTSPTPNATTVS